MKMEQKYIIMAAILMMILAITTALRMTILLSNLLLCHMQKKQLIL